MTRGWTLDNYTQEAWDRDLTALLQARNAQLAKFITLITVLCYDTPSPITWTNSQHKKLPEQSFIHRSGTTLPTHMRTSTWNSMGSLRTASERRANSSSTATRR